MPGSVVISRDRVPQLLRVIEDLTKSDLLVGVPGNTAPREAPPGGHAPMNNATLAYIHEFGLPEHNLPARPFLRPGIEGAIPAIVTRLRAGAKKALANLDDHEGGIKALEAAGLTAQNAVRAYINRGVPPPLAMSTLLKRQAERPNRKGPGLEIARRIATGVEGTDLVKPLVDTGQLRNSITYVIRPRRGGGSDILGPVKGK